VKPISSVLRASYPPSFRTAGGKKGSLKSGSGKKVTSRQQGVAICSRRGPEVPGENSEEEEILVMPVRGASPLCRREPRPCLSTGGSFRGCLKVEGTS
jgi:hypothetical protein